MMKKLSLAQALRAGVMASATAVIFNSILFFVFHTNGTLSDDIFVQPNQPLTIVSVIIASIMPTLVACLGLFLLEKFTNSGVKIFRVLTAGIGLISLAGPFMSIPGVTTGFATVLAAMHVVVVAALLYFTNKQANAVYTIA